MAQIFLCYAREDRPQVEEVYRRLQEEGFQPWMDKRDLVVGREWEPEVRRVLDSADFVLVFISSHSVARQGYFQREFQQALDIWERQHKPTGTIHTLPMRLDNCIVPEFLQRFHWGDLFDASGFEAIVAALRQGLVERQQQHEEQRLDYQAHREVQQLLWRGFGLFGAVELVLAVLTLTLEEGWNAVEPWTYFLGMLPAMFMYGYFVLTTREFSLHGIREQLVTTKKTRLSQNKQGIESTHTGMAKRQPAPDPPPEKPTEPVAVAPFSPGEAKQHQRRWAERLGVNIKITNTLGIEFVLIPAGEFMMGSNDAHNDERPVHKVHITQPFYLGKYEVTQGEWEAVIGNNLSRFTGDLNLPVEQVSWDDVQEFIQKLNAKEGGTKYRLPTEAEWEYACRACSTTTYSFGDNPNQLGEYTWYFDNSDRETHPVGQLKPNAWELYDMHGNVREWVQDWYGRDYYEQSPTSDPEGSASGAARVVRGGGWGGVAPLCRATFRYGLAPGRRVGTLGFRLPGLFPLALDRLYPWPAFWAWREPGCEEGSRDRRPSSRATGRPRATPVSRSRG